MSTFEIHPSPWTRKDNAVYDGNGDLVVLATSPDIAQMMTQARRMRAALWILWDMHIHNPRPFDPGRAVGHYWEDLEDMLRESDPDDLTTDAPELDDPPAPLGDFATLRHIIGMLPQLDTDQTGLVKRFVVNLVDALDPNQPPDLDDLRRELVAIAFEAEDREELIGALVELLQDAYKT